jgi:putative ATP-dependent endonuclease of OLD family
MYLYSLSANNFRQLTSFYVEFNKGLNLLVGENNSGKSSVIDAVRLVLDTTSSEWVNFKETDFQIGQSELSIQLKFEGLSTQELAIFLEYLTHEESGEELRNSVLYVNLKAGIATGFSNKNQFIKTELRSGKDADGPTIEREVRNYLTTTYLKPLRDAETELSAGRSSRLSQILGSSESLAGKHDVVERLIELLVAANNGIRGDLAIQEIQTAISVLINVLTFKADTFNPSLNILGSKPFDEMTDPERSFAIKAILERLTLQLGESGERQGLGYNSLLFMATELMLLKQEHDAFPLLLVEEPEAHLHPQLQMKFIKYLREDQDSLQCILSTHSPNLASKAPLESIILMQDGKAFPLRPGYTELEADDYVFLEKFLDTTKANMFFSRSVLLVEGVAEVVLLPKIAELLNRPLEDYGVSLVNVNGLSRKRYKKIYKPFVDEGTERDPLPIKVACMSDLDLWPDKAEIRADNPVGFKEKNAPDPDNKKKGNLQYWLSTYDDDPEGLDKRVAKKLEFDGGNVKTFISDQWTFEFCLAKYGLAKELYVAVTGGEEGFNDLSDDEEEKAIQIYQLLESQSSGKSDASYSLAVALSSYKDKPDELKDKLPPYIIKAIEYVTESFDEHT